jgi:predicted ATPase/DNA-binding CsgD family transcriptional regulator
MSEGEPVEGTRQAIGTPGLVDRRQEIQEITALLTSPDCRLLTLIGPGGIGKTRLAQRVVSEMVGQFAQGAVFVELQAVTSTEHLVSALIDALDIPLAGHQEPSRQLFGRLGPQSLLLALDNFEQLLDSAPLLADLLDHAPGVKLLITSREVLNLHEEWLYPVPGLPTRLAKSTEPQGVPGAVELFIQCAQRVRPDFDAAAEAPALVRICELVEGMPLAIELAASWTKSLSCAFIADKIERDLHFLTTRLRDLPERHRSILAVFEQSWRLLDKRQQAVFRRLAVFRGGFDHKGAEAVAGATLTDLALLLDKSLVRLDTRGRYQFHELLRQYAERQLQADAGELWETHYRHSQYFTEFLAQQLGAITGGGQLAAVAEIRGELENIRIAWQWAVDQGDVDAIGRAATTLALFYQMQSRFQEGVQRFAQAAHQLTKAGNAPQAVQVWITMQAHLGWLYIRLGQLEEAETVLRAGLTQLEAQGAIPAPGMATDPEIGLGIIALVRGDYPAAAHHAQMILHRSETPPHPWNRQFGLDLLARVALVTGDYHKTQELAQQAYALTQQTHDRWYMGYLLNLLGNATRRLGEAEMAQGYYEAAYALRQEFEDREGMAMTLAMLGDLALDQQAYDKAQTLFERSQQHFVEIGDLGGLATAEYGLGRTAYRRHAWDRARCHFRQSLQTIITVQYVPLGLAVLVDIARLMLHTGRSARGLHLLTFVLHHPAACNETQEQARTLLAANHLELPPPLAPANTLWQLMGELLAELDRPVAPPANVREIDHQQPVRPLQPQVESLTPRQFEILTLLANGLSNQEIARKLIMSIGTVKSHTGQIYGKLAAHNRVQAVTHARALGLI